MSEKQRLDEAETNIKSLRKKLYQHGECIDKGHDLEFDGAYYANQEHMDINLEFNIRSKCKRCGYEKWKKATSEEKEAILCLNIHVGI